MLVTLTLSMVSGDLSVFPLLPVMQMLLSSGRSGQFSVEHPRGGSLWLDQGYLVHAKSGALIGEDALQLICSLDAGTFIFDPEKNTSERSLSLGKDSALHRMMIDHESWVDLLRVFPDWSRSLCFTSRWTDRQPVTRPQFLLLDLVSQGFSLRTVIDHSNLSPKEVLETYRPFLTGGLIEII